MPDSADLEALRCRHCGEEIIGDDQDGWLHERTASRLCALVFEAEPEEAPDA